MKKSEPKGELEIKSNVKCLTQKAGDGIVVVRNTTHGGSLGLGNSSENIVDKNSVGKKLDLRKVNKCPGSDLLSGQQQKSTPSNITESSVINNSVNQQVNTENEEGKFTDDKEVDVIKNENNGSVDENNGSVDENNGSVDENNALQDPFREDMPVVENGYDNANGQDDKGKSVVKLERQEDNLKNQPRKGSFENINDDLKKCDELEKELAKACENTELAYENTELAANVAKANANSVLAKIDQRQKSLESRQEK